MSEADLPQLQYLIDSVIVIDHLNGQQWATEFILSYGHVSALSVITRAEVLAGTALDAEQQVLQLLNQFSTLPITLSVADAAARLRRTERWKLPDAIQAAIAIDQNLVLVTRNTKDFKDGQPVKVLIPYRA
mgnify:FL=1